MFPRKIIGRQFILHHILSQYIFLYPVAQSGEENWFLQESCDSRFLGRLLNLAPVIGGHNQYGDIPAILFPDLPRRLQSVHARHFPVKDDGVIVRALPAGFSHPGHRLCAAFRTFRNDAEFPQGLFHVFQNILPVIHHQNLQLRETQGHRRHIVQLHGNRHRKSGTFAGAAGYPDTSAQQLHQPFGYRHTQPAALRFIHAAVLFAGKRLKNMFHKILAHTDSRICYHNVQINRKGILSCPFCDIHSDRASGRCEFGSIG